MEEVKEDDVKAFDLIDKYAFITTRAIENKYIGYCYREHTEIKIDSGWRFLFGDENESFLDNPDNCETMDLSEIIVEYPHIKEIIEEKYDSEWEWNDTDKKFESIQ